MMLASRNKILLAALLFGSAWATCQSESYGQKARYQPRTPTVSPYLNLTRNNNGSGLPNYYALVRPQLNQQAINQREIALRSQQAGQLMRIESSLQRTSTASPTGVGSGFMVGGTKSTFLDTSHYYRPSNVGRGR